jgi:prepilin-type N-terminal cleavage/methylation domain-containing protein
MFYLMRKIKKSQKGFTLVELMVAMGIVAILSAIAVPNFLAALPTFKLRAAARDLYGTLQKARVEAVRQGKSAAVVFNVATGQYMVCVEIDPTLVTTDWEWASLTNVSCDVGTIITLSDYKYGVAISGASVGGSTPKGASFGNGVTYSDDAAVFDAKGFGELGYCYLTNENNESFAIGSLSSGVIKMFKWSGTAWGQ